MAPTAQKPTHIAVLLVPPVQFLDTAPIDLFGMLSAEYLHACRLPQPLIDHAVPVRVSYVAESGPGSVAELTAWAGLRVTHGLSSKEVRPGEVDVLLIPGPDPQAVVPEAVKAFIRGHASVGTVVMTVCTGAFVAGPAGVLDGKRATGPRALLGELRGKFPKATWEDKRWTHDGNIWTSAGVTNGNDMVAAYIRETWPGPTAEAALAMADVGDRGQGYRIGQARDNAWWVWQIFRAWMRK